MATVALTAVETLIADGTTYVSSAQAFDTKTFFASDFDDNDHVRFETTSTGKIEACDHYGRRIGIVPAESSAVAVRNANADWMWFAAAQPPAALVANASDLATCQTLANALKTILVNAGLMKAE